MEEANEVNFEKGGQEAEEKLVERKLREFFNHSDEWLSLLARACQAEPTKQNYGSNH